MLLLVVDVGFLGFCGRVDCMFNSSSVLFGRPVVGLGTGFSSCLSLKGAPSFSPHGDFEIDDYSEDWVVGVGVSTGDFWGVSHAPKKGSFLFPDGVKSFGSGVSDGSEEFCRGFGFEVGREPVGVASAGGVVDGWLVDRVLFRRVLCAHVDGMRGRVNDGVLTRRSVEGVCGSVWGLLGLWREFSALSFTPCVGSPVAQNMSWDGSNFLRSVNVLRAVRVWNLWVLDCVLSAGVGVDLGMVVARWVDEGGVVHDVCLRDVVSGGVLNPRAVLGDCDVDSVNGFVAGTVVLSLADFVRYGVLRGHGACGATLGDCEPLVGVSGLGGACVGGGRLLDSVGFLCSVLVGDSHGLSDVLEVVRRVGFGVGVFDGVRDGVDRVVFGCVYDDIVCGGDGGVDGVGNVVGCSRGVFIGTPVRAMEKGLAGSGVTDNVSFATAVFFGVGGLQLLRDRVVAAGDGCVVSGACCLDRGFDVVAQRVAAARGGDDDGVDNRGDGGGVSGLFGLTDNGFLCGVGFGGLCDDGVVGELFGLFRDASRVKLVLDGFVDHVWFDVAVLCGLHGVFRGVDFHVGVDRVVPSGVLERRFASVLATRVALAVGGCGVDGGCGGLVLNTALLGSQCDRNMIVFDGGSGGSGGTVSGGGVVGNVYTANGIAVVSDATYPTGFCGGDEDNTFGFFGGGFGGGCDSVSYTGVSHTGVGGCFVGVGDLGVGSVVSFDRGAVQTVVDGRGKTVVVSHLVLPTNTGFTVSRSDVATVGGVVLAYYSLLGAFENTVFYRGLLDKLTVSERECFVGLLRRLVVSQGCGSPVLVDALCGRGGVSWVFDSRGCVGAVTMVVAAAVLLHEGGFVLGDGAPDGGFGVLFDCVSGVPVSTGVRQCVRFDRGWLYRVFVACVIGDVVGRYGVVSSVGLGGVSYPGECRGVEPCLLFPLFAVGFADVVCDDMWSPDNNAGVGVVGGGHSVVNASNVDGGVNENTGSSMFTLLFELLGLAAGVDARDTSVLDVLDTTLPSDGDSLDHAVVLHRATMLMFVNKLTSNAFTVTSAKTMLDIGDKKSRYGYYGDYDENGLASEKSLMYVLWSMLGASACGVVWADDYIRVVAESIGYVHSKLVEKSMVEHRIVSLRGVLGCARMMVTETQLDVPLSIMDVVLNT